MEIRYYNVSRDIVLGRLARVLSRIPELKIAIVFGSILRREVVRDLDVAVVFELELSFRDFLRLGNMVEDEVGIPVDLLLLMEAPPKFRLKILRDGLKLIIKDHRLYSMILKQTIAEIMDTNIKIANSRKA